LRPSGLIIGLVSAAVGIAAWQAARWLHRRYLAPVIDRQFFRQAYDARQIVAELSESLRTTAEIPRLLGSVANAASGATDQRRRHAAARWGDRRISALMRASTAGPKVVQSSRRARVI
jgi:hypothetical protein